MVSYNGINNIWVTGTLEKGAISLPKTTLRSESQRPRCLTKETPSPLVLITKKTTTGNVVNSEKRYDKKVKEKNGLIINQLSTHTVPNWTLFNK